MASHQEQAQKEIRDKKEREARLDQERQDRQELLASLPKLQCDTFLKIKDNKLLLPNTGVATLKRTLWRDGRYLGIIESLLCDETVIDEIDLKPLQVMKQMPVSEYEFIYHARSDGG